MQSFSERSIATIAPRPLALREVPAAERPRERLALRGAAGLTSAELIALLWGSGSRGRNAVDLAEAVLARLDGVSGLALASAAELQAVSGVGPARAAQVQAAFELGRRLLADWPVGRWQIRSPRDVADRLVLQMGRLEREELRAVILNTKNVVKVDLWRAELGPGPPAGVPPTAMVDVTHGASCREAVRI